MKNGDSMNVRTGFASTGAALLALATTLTGCSTSQPSTGGISSEGGTPTPITTAPTPIASTSSAPPTSTTAPPTSEGPTENPTSTEPPLPDCGAGQPAPLSAADSPTLASALVVASRFGQLWLYTVATDASQVWTGSSGESPVFRSTGMVTYLARTVIQRSLADGTETELVRAPEPVYAQGWNASGTKLVYLVGHAANNRELPRIVCLYNANTGRVRSLHVTTGPAPGREGVVTDEQSVSWSPDGSAIAVVDSVIWKGNALQVISPTGEPLIDPLHATFARWLPDGRLLYATYEAQTTAWYALDIHTGTRSRVALPSGAAWPAVSPDGTTIAFVDARTSTPIAKVLTVATGTVTTLGQNLVNPVWISPTEVALTRTTDCPPKNECPGGGWYPTKRTVGIDVSSVTRQKLQLKSTLSTDVRFPS